jgi:hypothetical protein
MDGWIAKEIGISFLISSQPEDWMTLTYVFGDDNGRRERERERERERRRGDEVDAFFTRMTKL